MSEEFHVNKWAFEPLRNWGKRVVPPGLHQYLKPFVLAALKLYNRVPNFSFVLLPPELPRLSYLQRVKLAYRLDRVSAHVPCSHNDEQMMKVFREVLALPQEAPGCILEAGCFKGGSGAKFSILAKLTGRKLVLFDSFEGIPSNEEIHDVTIFGEEIADDAFSAGEYSGALAEVKGNIERFGHIEVCTFHKGWFDDTMPSFTEQVCVAYIDVDLASSTKTCLQYIYPLLIPGGSLLSQDGHLPLVLDVFEDKTFWREEIGIERPVVEGAGTDQMLLVRKPAG